jgi:hypothetical protein
MAVSRIVALIALALCAASMSNAFPSATSKDWSTYRLLGARDPASPVAIVEYRHHRTGPATVETTHLLLRSGSEWRDVTPPRLKWFIDDAYFVDHRHGWIVTSECGAAKGAMYRTRDGGKTWRKLSWDYTHNCAAGSGFRLMFVDPHNGWVAAPTPNGGFGSVFRTANGGRRWLQSGRYDGPVLDEVVFTTPRAGWGIGLAWLHQDPLFRTFDAGRTWHAESDLPRLRYSTPIFFGGRGIVMGIRRGIARFYSRVGGRWRSAGKLDVRGVRFPDFRASTQNTWWVYGVSGTQPVVLVTRNTGRTWAKTSLAGPAYFAELRVTSRRAWLATTRLNGDTALFSSGDFGRTWTRVSP